MLFDMHIHTQEYSGDSMLSINSILKSAKELGLAGVCITDHGSSGFRSQAKKLSDSTGLSVIVGMEYSCMEGHLLVFGVSGKIAPGLSLVEALGEIKRGDGIAIAAHPFRWDTPLMGAAVRRCCKMLDGIEAFNGGGSAEENLIAHDFARDNDLPMFGGSDAHHQGRVGRFATEIIASVRSDADLVEAVRNAKTGKKAAGNIFPMARKGHLYAPAFSNEKQYHDRYSPPAVKSLNEIFQRTKTRS